MLKSSIIERIENFFTNRFNENEVFVSSDYKKKVLSLNRSPLYASLQWLQDVKAVDGDDLEMFEHIKRCLNKFTHEMLTFASSGDL